MTWQIYITISIIFNAFANLANRQLMKNNKNDSYLFAVIFQAGGTLLILLSGLLLDRISFPDLSSVYLNLWFMMLLYGLGSVMVFESFKRVEASNFTIVFASRVIIIIIVSRLFLGESLELQQLLGSLLLLLGVVIVTLKNNKLNFGKDIIYVILAAIFFGLALTNDKYILNTIDIDVFSFLVLGFALPVVPMLLLRPKTFRNVKQLADRRNFIYITLLTVLYMSQAIGYYLAIEQVEVSLVASLNQVTDVLTVILAIIILRETDGLARKLVGVAVSFVGLLLI